MGEPRPSFFRSIFRTVSKEGALPEDIDPDEYMLSTGNEDFDEEDLRDFALDSDLELGQEFRDKIIPFAVRWYTGEATPDGDEDDDDEDDESDEEDEPPAKNKGKKAAGK